MVDSVYRTRSLGVAAEGLPDQYADGEAARVWQLYIGDTRSRTDEYTRPGCSGCCASTAASGCSTWPVALGEPGQGPGDRSERERVAGGGGPG